MTVTQIYLQVQYVAHDWILQESPGDSLLLSLASHLRENLADVRLLRDSPGLIGENLVLSEV